MKPARFQYVAPRTVEEAIGVLTRYGDGCKLLAGGQSLGPLLNLRLATPDVLVDLERIDELAAPPSRVDSVIRIPAMTRQRSLELSPIVRTHVPLLSDALPFVAHRTIRNRGTIGGSLAHADPSAELPAVALACGAAIVIQGPTGQRRVSAEAFFQGYFTTALYPDEVVVAVEFPAAVARQGSSWVEFAPRRGDFAIVGAAAVVQLSPHGTVASCRLAYSGVSDRPWRDETSESRLVGEYPSPQVFDRIADSFAERCEPIGDLSGSAVYRKGLVRHLTAAVLASACRQATEDQ